MNETKGETIDRVVNGLIADTMNRSEAIATLIILLASQKEEIQKAIEGKRIEQDWDNGDLTFNDGLDAALKAIKDLPS